MTYERIGRVASLLQELSAVFIRDEANASPLITVTGVEVSSDLRQATILVSIFPEAEEQQALIFLKRKGGALRSFVKEKARLKDIPHFDFSVDHGEKNRQILDEIAYRQMQSEKDAN